MADDAVLVTDIAAKAVISNADGKVLILREANYRGGTQRGRYHVPGGRLNTGEAFLDGLKREVMEETGLQVEPLYPVHVDEWRPVIHGVPHHIIAVFMACKVQGNDTVITGNEHDEAVWIRPADVNKYDLLPEYRLAIERYAAR